MKDYILEMRHVGKVFPGVQALSDVNFGIERGEIHALIGENGAGKSTLIKCLTGIHHPDEGEIYFNGEHVIINNASDSKKLGIAVIHQELTMAGNMTVAENIFMGKFPTKENSFFVDDRKMNEQAAQFLHELELDYIDPTSLVKKLSIGQQQMVEICRALSENATLFVMDEPTASLASRETEILLNIMRKLKNNGVSIIFVSHKLEEVYRVCDRITVLRDGKYIGTEFTSQLPYDNLISMMIGREISNMFPPYTISPGEKFFEAKGINSARVTDVSFDLCKGEILGFYGLVGSGRSETIRAMLGIDKSTVESITLNGRQIHISNPVEAVNEGIVLAPEDRKKEGLILKQTIDFNITISILKDIIKGIRFRKKHNDKVVSEIGSRLRIKTPSYDVKTKQLSGGNQQKVVLAKWLITDPQILILDEPTRGIDVGAKQEIYNLIYEIAKTGVSIIFISSEMAEVIHLSSRVNVMKNGCIVGRLAREELTEENIIKLAIGGN